MYLLDFNVRIVFGLLLLKKCGLITCTALEHSPTLPHASLFFPSLLLAFLAPFSCPSLLPFLSLW